MAHKVHPKSHRLKNAADWDSRGFYRVPAVYVEEDFRIREFLKGKLSKMAVERIEIERFPGKLHIIVSSARPGLIIGRGGGGVEELRKELEQKIFGAPKVALFYRMFTKNAAGGDRVKSKGEKKKSEAKKKEIKQSAQTSENAGKKKQEIKIEIREVKNPWTSAALTAQWAAQQIEKRVAFRRVMKQVLTKLGEYKEIQGAKIEMSGRLNGNEIARREWLKIGRLPLQTLRADVDYSLAEAHCTYGVIGIKVWIYKGEKFE